MPQGPLPINIATGPAAGKPRVPISADAGGNMQIVQAHGTRYNASFNKRLFFAANQAGVTTTAGLATTYTGLCLSNPAASLVNLSPRRISGVFVVAPAALTALGLIVGWAAGGITAHTTPLTSLQSTFLGSGVVPSALVDAACTLVGTPTYEDFMAITPSATGVVGFSMDLDGEVTIPPGGYLAIGTSIAGPASGLLAKIAWEEIPVSG